MKRVIFTILLLFAITPVVFADDFDFPTSAGEDLWDNWNTREDMREAKPVSDKEFEKAIEQVDKKVNKWKNWAQRRKIPKGQELIKHVNAGTDSNIINETEILDENYGEKKSAPVVCLPVDIDLGKGQILPIGHYQVEGEKVDGVATLVFYQSGEKIAQIQATETEDDFEEKEISFVKWKTKGDNQIQLEFGSLDFNAFAVLDIAQSTN